MAKDKTLDVTVETTKGNWEHGFEKTTKVSEVISETVNHFGFDPNGDFKLFLDPDRNNPLDPSRPLVSYHVKDGDILVLTEYGTAV